MTTSLTKPWHAMTVSETFTALGGRSDGLSAAQANARLNKHGPNQIPETGRHTRLLIILRQLNNPLTLILFVATVVSFALGGKYRRRFHFARYRYQCFSRRLSGMARRGERRIFEKKTLRISPTVIRAGARRKVDIAEIVPGDIVCLESGVVVPADIRLSAAHDLRIDESPADWGVETG